MDRKTKSLWIVIDRLRIRKCLYFEKQFGFNLFNCQKTLARYLYPVPNPKFQPVSRKFHFCFLRQSLDLKPIFRNQLSLYSNSPFSVAPSLMISIKNSLIFPMSLILLYWKSNFTVITKFFPSIKVSRKSFPLLVNCSIREFLMMFLASELFWCKTFKKCVYEIITSRFKSFFLITTSFFSSTEIPTHYEAFFWYWTVGMEKVDAVARRHDFSNRGLNWSPQVFTGPFD